MSKTEADGYQDLKQRTTTSILWSVLRVLWSTGATFVIFVCLARILGPSDFGLFALAALFLDVSRIFASAGLGDAIIRQHVLEEEMADTAFWANFGLSTIVATIVIIAAPFYAQMIHNTNVTHILQALALTLPISSLAGIHGARLTREYKHKLFAIQAAIASIVSGISGITAALMGLGVWSLVVQAWVGAILGVIMAWVASRWVPKVRFSPSMLRQIASFSFSTTFNQLLWLLMGRVGDILISRNYGQAEVGRYRIAWRMYELIGQLALAPIGSVSMLTFSKLQHEPEKLKAAYYRMISIVGLLVLPLLLGYAALAEEIIKVIFSEQWAGTGKISQVLALMIVPFVFNYISPGMLAAVNKPGAITKVAALQLALTILFTWLALPWGLVGIAAAYALRSYLTLPYQQYQLKRFVNIPVLTALSKPLVPLLVALFMAAVVWSLRPVLFGIYDNLWFVVITGSFIGAVIYVSGILIFGRSLVAPIITQAQPILNRILKRKPV
jgi:O-antigen/teichoic acid export membrane protein